MKNSNDYKNDIFIQVFCFNFYQFLPIIIKKSTFS